MSHHQSDPILLAISWQNLIHALRIEPGYFAVLAVERVFLRDPSKFDFLRTNTSRDKAVSYTCYSHKTKQFQVYFYQNLRFFHIQHFEKNFFTAQQKYFLMMSQQKGLC